MRYLLVVLGAGEVRSYERFYEIGIGACAGDDIDSEATMYTVDFGTRSQTEAQTRILLRNVKRIVEDIGNSVDIVG